MKTLNKPDTNRAAVESEYIDIIDISIRLKMK